jgi:hypothetical protein
MESLPIALQQTQNGGKAALGTPIFFDLGAGDGLLRMLVLQGFSIH